MKVVDPIAGGGTVFDGYIITHPPTTWPFNTFIMFKENDNVSDAGGYISK